MVRPLFPSVKQKLFLRLFRVVGSLTLLFSLSNGISPACSYHPQKRERMASIFRSRSHTNHFLMIKAVPALLALTLLIFSCAPVERGPRAPVPPSVAETPESLYPKAEDYLAAGNKERALQIYAEILERYPDSSLTPDSLLRIAQIQESMKNYDQAAAAANRFLNDYPSNPMKVTVLLVLARIRLQEDKLQSARSLLSEAEPLVSTPAERADLKLVLASMDEREGRLANALGLLTEVHDSGLQPYQQQAVERVRGIMTLLSIEELGAASATYGNRFPEDIILGELGRRYMNAHQFSKAETALTRILDIYPNSPEAQEARKGLESIKKRMSVNPRNIGCILPLSGTHAAYGQKILFGLMLGLGGYSQSQEASPFRLIVRDSKGSDALAAQYVDELVKQEKAGAIVGPLLSGPSKSAAQEAQKIGVPIITLTQSENIADTGDFVFRNFLTPSMQMRSLVDYITDVRKLSRFAIFYPQSDYGKLYMELFWNEVKRKAGRVTAAEGYNPKQTDFRKPFATLLKIDEKRTQTPEQEIEVIMSDVDLDHGPYPIVDFQALFIPDDYRSILMIAPQVAYYDVTDLTLLGTNLWNSPVLLKGERYVQGSIFPADFYLNSPSPNVVEFRTRFDEVFDREPDFFSAIGYDTAKILMQAITQNQAWTREEIRDALMKVKDFPGVTGVTSFAANGDADKKLFMLTIEGDAIVAAPF